MGPFLEVWDSVAIEIEDIREGPDGSVMMQVSGAFRGESSGVPTEIRAWRSCGSPTAWSLGDS